MKELLVVSLGSTGEQEGRLLELASWMGVPTRAVPISGDADLIEQVSARGTRARVCLALSGNTLLAIDRSESSERFKNFLRDACEALLIFGIADSVLHKRALQWLTEDAVSVSPSPAGYDLSFNFPAEARRFSRQLAGLSFRTGDGMSLPGLRLPATREDAEAIMLQGGAPVFAHVRRSACPVFMLVEIPMPDVHERLSPGRVMGDLYERLIPPLIFLRHSFGNACWHGVDRTARVIIDDPLLQKRYGCLDFERLKGSMGKTGYGTTVAFIPWNYRRTSERKASTFSAESSNISICVHGCDHTSNEFGIRDREILSQKARLAMQRMEAHESRTRIPFERIMVFPQGRFSTEALGALRANGYLAAVDSGCFPIGSSKASLSVADFLRPAIQFEGFPVFKRHYPRRLIDFAFDLFLGKPVLIVEHHGYFRDGGESLELLVEELRRIEPGLKWSTLTSQLTRSCFRRSRSEGEVDVQFYTSEFHLRNGSERLVRYYLSKQEADPTLIRRILVEGVSVPFSAHGGSLCFELEVDPGRTMKIEIEDRERPARPAFRGSKRHDMRVRLRRILAEFRDERLVRHPGLLKAATRVARALGVRVGV